MSSEARMKRCFVISPIGAEGSESREHADDVFEFIIQPAMQRCGFQAFRADHFREPGKITQQMLDAILTYDLCVALLTGNNANVYYELAIAQSAERPVILLLLKGEEPPFDIHDLRLVYYDLKPRELRNGTYVDAIVEHLQTFERLSWRPTSIFDGASPLRTLAEGSEGSRFLAKADDLGSNDAWLQLILDSEKTIELMGATLRAWSRRKDFGGVLSRKAKAGCSIRILIGDAENEGLRYRDRLAMNERDDTAMADDIRTMTRYFAALSSQNDGISFRQIRFGMPPFRVTRTDQLVTFVPYLYSEPGGYSPLWQAASGSALYRLMQNEFETLWEANAPRREL